LQLAPHLCFFYFSIFTGLKDFHISNTYAHYCSHQIQPTCIVLNNARDLVLQGVALEAPVVAVRILLGGVAREAVRNTEELIGGRVRL